jgi:hypothetical protein
MAMDFQCLLPYDIYISIRTWPPNCSLIPVAQELQLTYVPQGEDQMQGSSYDLIR